MRPAGWLHRKLCTAHGCCSLPITDGLLYDVEVTPVALAGRVPRIILRSCLDRTENYSVVRNWFI